MGGMVGTKEKQQRKETSNFFRKQMISSNRDFSISEEYQLLEKIGNGTYAEVYKAQSKRTKKICAIKRVDKSKVKGISILLQNQFAILRQLDHPNIIKVYGMYEDGKDYYIISELAKGKELYEYFKDKKKLAEKQAFIVFNQVLLAVSHLHKNSIMHRDIKLQNIIYDPQTRILKLLDFGSATQYDTTSPNPYKCVGTVSYIAPQVIDKMYNYKCDHWSLGVFLYLLLSGNTPFTGKDQEDTFQRIKKQPLQFSKPVWETVSSEVKKLIQSLMEKNPQKRIDFDEVIKNKWFCTQRGAQSISQQDQSQMMMVLGRLRKFGKVKIAQIQLGVLVFMINFVVAIEDQDRMIRCFHLIDSAGDGVITIPQLVQAMVEYEDRPSKMAETQAREIMSRIDFNSSQDISYSQYLVAGADLEKILTDENLEKTFVMIDTDQSQKLSVKEIKAKLGDEISGAYYAKLISFFDQDKDGEISLSEFKRMMKKLK